jgi:hypothetical protein
MSSKFSTPFMAKSPCKEVVVPTKKKVYNRTAELKEILKPKKTKKPKIKV